MSEKINSGNNGGGENSWDDLAKMDSNQGEKAIPREEITNEMLNELTAQLTEKEKALLFDMYIDGYDAYSHMKEIIANRDADKASADK